MRKLGFFFLLFLAKTVSAQQIPPTIQTISALDSGVACSVTGSCASWSLPSQPTVTIQITGSCSCTLTFESTSDGQTWFSVSATNLSTGTAATTTTTTGQYSIANTGVVSVRARATTFASGGLNLKATQGWSSLARSGGGSGGTPGGSSGDLQYNNAGSFGGYTPAAGVVTFIQTPSSANLAAALTDETGSGVAMFGTLPTITTGAIVNESAGTSALVLTGATQTASFPAINVTQTWNNSGVTFAAVKINVTSTASAAASLLLDLQVGATSQWSVSKAGAVVQLGPLSVPIGSNTATTLNFGTANSGFYSASANVILMALGGFAGYFRWDGTYYTLGQGAALGFNSGAAAGSPDLIVSRAAASILGLAGASSGATIDFLEMAAPAAGATNHARLYAEDTGGGKTRLVVIFPTGAAQVIATEP